MAQTDDLQNLVALGHVVDIWGENIKGKMSALPTLALVFNVVARRAFTPADKQYGALDESAYQVIKKNGLKEESREEQAGALEKSLRERNKNIGLISAFMSRKKTNAALPPIENLPQLLDVSERYQLREISKLLSSAVNRAPDQA